MNISGLWRQCPTGKEQDHELHAQKVEIVGETDPEVGFCLDSENM